MVRPSWKDAANLRKKKKEEFKRISEAIQIPQTINYVNPHYYRTVSAMKNKIPKRAFQEILSYLEPVNRRTLRASVSASKPLTTPQLRASRRLKARERARQRGAGTRGKGRRRRRGGRTRRH